MYPGAHAQTTPDKPAYIMGGSGEVVTYRELDERSNRLAHVFRAAGLQRGDAIALMMENHPRYFEILWAAQRAGLYYTAMSSRLTQSEAEYIVNDCGAKAFITSHYKRDVAEQLIAGTPDVQVRLMLDGTIDGYESYEDAVAAQPSTPIDDESEGIDMLYSSGTTGRPKGVRLNLPEGAMGQPLGVAGLGLALYSFNPDMVYLSPAPLYHAAPLRFSMAVQRVGGTVVVMESFDPVDFLRLVEERKVTHTQVVPTRFVRMLKLPEGDRLKWDVSSLQVVIHAAAPCPIPVKEQMIEWWGPKIMEYYAGTEGNGFCAITSEEWLTHRGSVGRALLGEIHIVGEDGEEVAGPRQEGTIYFASGAPFEYHNDPEKTASSRDPKGRGWSTLGDVGYVDEEGYLYLTDRKAYMIISGGVNIYPQEAENVLTTHPKVLDVAVIGVPNEDFGEEVKAVVQPVNMADAGPELERELIAFCRSQLADVKCPRSVDFVEELPRHPTGKLYKRLLRDKYWEGRQSRIV
ncbi:MAG: long-chain acyl-CoA synthetase [Actinomycetota bacterium]|nr:long-chain acyl-CoA synthetase [Actinomycetota bacterium]